MGVLLGIPTEGYGSGVTICKCKCTVIVDEVSAPLVCYISLTVLLLYQQTAPPPPHHSTTITSSIDIPRYPFNGCSESELGGLL